MNWTEFPKCWARVESFPEKLDSTQHLLLTSSNSVLSAPHHESEESVFNFHFSPHLSLTSSLCLSLSMTLLLFDPSGTLSMCSTQLNMWFLVIWSQRLQCFLILRLQCFLILFFWLFNEEVCNSRTSDNVCHKPGVTEWNSALSQWPHFEGIGVSHYRPFDRTQKHTKTTILAREQIIKKNRTISGAILLLFGLKCVTKLTERVTYGWKQNRSVCHVSAGIDPTQ